MNEMLSVELDELLSSKMKSVFMWMFGGVLLTTIVMFGVLTNYNFAMTIYGLFFPLIIAEFAVVFFLSARIYKLQVGTAKSLFLGYSFLNGLTLSSLALSYNLEVILQAFIGATILFGTMAIYGYVTKEDLSKMGGLLRGGLFALIGVSLFNLFLRNPAIYWFMSYFGVVLFMGLTAFDVHKIKRTLTALIISGEQGQEELSEKFVIIGALELYLDFINIFIYLLRIFGRRD